MIAAPALAEALEGKRVGRSWRCACPVHHGHSLIVKETHDGFTLVHCKFGCAQGDVIAELRRLGLWGGRADYDPEQAAEMDRRAEVRRKTEAERIKWRIDQSRNAIRRAVFGSSVIGNYLLTRGIILMVLGRLGFLEHCPHRHDPRYPQDYLPAMVAAVFNAAGQQTGLHKTFLRPDGSGKAEVPKDLQREFIGSISGGSVRLAHHDPRRELIVAEGIETTLSAMQIYGLPGWAALSAEGIRNLELPRSVRLILICADHDANGVGIAAAHAARKRWSREGKSVRICWPRTVGEDFNDVLLRNGGA